MPGDSFTFDASEPVGDPLAHLSAGKDWAASPSPVHRHQADLQDIVRHVKRVFSPLERDLIGFGPLLIQSLYALLTRENLLLFSPAGTAKTLFAGLFFSRIRGARVFDTQMSKGTLAEDIFGSIDTEQMKRGRVVHNTQGTLVDADLAFIDELFDANDMVLRALLGVLNERVFKKGSQLEKARLHLGIAATNYLRASDLTEAVLDRFLFRGYIAPDYSPFALAAIDEAFARHFGRPTAPPTEAQIAIEDLGLLAEVIRGGIPSRQIAAPAHVLFMKNVVLNRYQELFRESSETARKRPLYISPRTYAKSRFVLNAAAVLRGRMEVQPEDIAELRYVVTTVGGREEEAASFDKALHETLLKIRGTDFENIDNLVDAHELAEQMMARVGEGVEIKADRFLQRILRFFGLVSKGDVTFDHVRRYVDGIQPQDEQVKRLQQGVVKRIQELARRVDNGTDSILN